MSDPANFGDTARQYVTRIAAQKRWGLRVLEASALVALVSAFYPW